ncbi:MAG TPA: ABC transporter ATP-binding protein [Chloroflexota bacterium]|nr:ABC transporter ATP-binding protein [Chloroflexota bacterium]
MTAPPRPAAAGTDGAAPGAGRLRADRVSLGYGRLPVLDGLSFDVPPGQVTSIIGPNGCGKSTLLRALVRLLKPRGGAVLLDGQSIHRLSTKAVARELGLLPQQSLLPEAVTVEDLVRRGRYPHLGVFQTPSREDEVIVQRAMAMAGVTELGARAVDELSGGQRQRAWIAMTLAQETPILLLDEPTTFLDVAHQHEVMSLVQRLNREDGRTVVLVLHDVNAAAAVSQHIVAMRDGVIVAAGPPRETLTPEVLEQVFGVACDVVRHPDTGQPVSVPRGRPLQAPGAGPGAGPEAAPALRTEALCGGYGARAVLQDVSVVFPPGRISAIVGPNACGKSTLLKTLARLLPAGSGEAWLGDRPIRRGAHRAFARHLALLAQDPSAPAGVLVEDLVAAGRFPYQRWYRQWTEGDQAAIDRSIAAAGLEALRLRPVETLSGGQRQRVWLALALAQETPVLLLDEPTTFLDMAHAVETLDLVRELNERDGRTVVLVLHDLGQACRYADHVVAMRAGRVVACGDPREVVTEALVGEVFGLNCRIVPDPLTGKPLVLPVD